MFAFSLRPAAEIFRLNVGIMLLNWLSIVSTFWMLAAGYHYDTFSSDSSNGSCSLAAESSVRWFSWGCLTIGWRWPMPGRSLQVLLLSLVTLAAAAPQSLVSDEVEKPQIRLLNSFFKEDGRGNYQYGYEQDNGQKVGVEMVVDFPRHAIPIVMTPFLSSRPLERKGANKGILVILQSNLYGRYSTKVFGD